MPEMRKPELILHIEPFLRICQNPLREQTVPEDITGFIVIKIHVRFDEGMPINNLITRTGFSDLSFHLPSEPFDFTVGQ